MKVSIRDTKTGNVVAELPIVIKGLNYTPTQSEYFAEAWRCAVDDQSVDPGRKADYEFVLHDG